MIELTIFQYYGLIYLLVGTIMGFILESIVRSTGEEEVNMRERFSLIVLWPFMVMVFIYSFIKGFFDR